MTSPTKNTKSKTFQYFFIAI